MSVEAGHASQHSQSAAWVLQSLDPGDARSFERHLAGCKECQNAVAQFQVVAALLDCPGCAAELPADLEAKTVAAVQYAVMTAGRRASGERKISLWWHRH